MILYANLFLSLTFTYLFFSDEIQREIYLKRTTQSKWGQGLLCWFQHHLSTLLSSTGYPATLARDFTFTFFFFGSYEFFKYYLESERSPFVSWASVIAGGLAGATSTTIALPFDVLKTRLQTQLALPKGQRRFLLVFLFSFFSVFTSSYSTFREAVKFIIHEEGPKTLMKGLGPRLIQTIPASSVTFFSYEWVKRKLAEFE